MTRAYELNFKLYLILISLYLHFKIDDVVIGKHLQMCGTTCVCESTLSIANFMKSKYRSFSDANLASAVSVK